MTAAFAEPITFRRAVEAALKHSGTMAIAQADQTKTYQEYLSAKDSYLPSVAFGSGVGYSVGIPLAIVGTAPSIFNVTTQQSVFDPALRKSIEAAKVDWKATDLDLVDKKNAVIMQTAVAYSGLDNVTSKLKILHEAQAAAQQAEYISQQRLKQGIDSELDLKKTQLASAQVALSIAEAEAQADVYRDQLSQLTGFPAASIETVAESVPIPPDIPQDPNVPGDAADRNPTVRMAFEKAKSAELRAKAEHNRMLPAFDFGTQYALLSTFNNYDQVYKKFTRNNYTFGLNIRFNFLNFGQRAAAEAADADAIRAKKMAESAKDDAELEALKLQRSLRQLAAAKDVAKLQWEIAQAGVDAVQAKIETGQASSRDLEAARMDANDRYAQYLDASQQLFTATVQMLRSTGKIQEWALEK
ncbi:MAG: TolC family protein [Terriglobia bacterium]|nr:TolC family protein [Terriglobia bacterium]